MGKRKADAKHREQGRALWSAVYLMHYNAKRKGIARVAFIHADAALKQFEERFGKLPEGSGHH